MKSLFIFLALSGACAWAEEAKQWSHESVASIVQVGGNTSSESYSLKQKTGYKIDTHVFTGSARYLQSKANQVETAKQWDANLRYEKELGENWGMFLQHGAESDSYAGYTQRDNSDIGGKYIFFNQANQNLLGEFGYRYIKTQFTSGELTYASAGRFYLEYNSKINDSVAGKLWAEYLPNFSDSEAYLVNYEPSINVMMNQILSLKVAYLVKYHNKTKIAGEKKEDTSFTTALVAKF